jgi:hypothetical protein
VRLILIRHAEPEAHIKRVVAGPKGCTGLIGRGQAQAAALSDRLAREAEHFDVLYSSVLARAVETAQIVARSLGLSGLRQDCDLCELHPGECGGMTWEDRARVYGPDWARGPDQPISPGGESLHSFDRRVRAAVDQRIFQGSSTMPPATTLNGRRSTLIPTLSVVIPRARWCSGACRAERGSRSLTRSRCSGSVRATLLSATPSRT